jgi:hypothetical protein
MRQEKMKFKNTKEMLSFLDGLKKRNENAIKHHDLEIKKYKNSLRKIQEIVAEPSIPYKKKTK